MYKHINIDLIGEDGNAFAIMGRVQKAMRREDCTEEEISSIMDEMKSGNYDHLLQTVMKNFSTDEDADWYDGIEDWDNDDEEEDYS